MQHAPSHQHKKKSTCPMVSFFLFMGQKLREKPKRHANFFPGTMEQNWFKSKHVALHQHEKNFSCHHTLSLVLSSLTYHCLGEAAWLLCFSAHVKNKHEAEWSVVFHAYKCLFLDWQEAGTQVPWCDTDKKYVISVKRVLRNFRILLYFKDWAILILTSINL